MRKKLLDGLRHHLNVSLPLVFRESKDISTDPTFVDGHVGFLLDAVGSYFVFLALVANDDSDSFRVNVAWSKKPTYPSMPYRDLRASASDFIGRPECEFQLALLSKDKIPWVWYLDSSFGRWKLELDQISAEIAAGRMVKQEIYTRLLMQMPKKCSLNEALKTITPVVDQLIAILEKHLKPYLRALARQS